MATNPALSLLDVADAGETFWRLRIAYRHPVYASETAILREAVRRAAKIGKGATTDASRADFAAYAGLYRRAFVAGVIRAQREALSLYINVMSGNIRGGATCSTTPSQRSSRT